MPLGDWGRTGCGGRRPREPDIVTRVSTSLFALTALLCITSWPYTGDQALFQLYAEAMVDGQAYWRDLWDYKQPGLFWFYAATSLFVDGGLGARLGEVALLVVAAVVVVRLARRWEAPEAVVVASPWIVLGPLVLGTAAGGVGQMEGLIALPLLLQVWAVERLWAGRDERRAGLLAGLVTGAVVVTKVLYLPMAAVIPLAGALMARRRGHRVRSFVTTWVLAFAAVLAVSTAVVAFTGALTVGLVTTLVLPFRVLGTGLLETFHVGVARFPVVLYSAGFVLALPALAAARSPRAERERVLVVAAVVTAVNITPQLPTTYRFLALAVPVGLLAVLGATRWAQMPDRRRPRVVFALAAALAAPATLVYGGHLVSAFARDGVTLASDRPLVQTDTGLATRLDQLTCAAPTGRHVGVRMWVVGDARVYAALGATQAIAVNGWAPEFYDATVWNEATRELDLVRPSAVMIEDEYRGFVVQGAPKILEQLVRDYRELPRCGPDDRAQWYVLTDPTATVTAVEPVRLEP